MGLLSWQKTLDSPFSVLAPKTDPHARGAGPGAGGDPVCPWPPGENGVLHALRPEHAAMTVFCEILTPHG